jgi:hypothetical protein
MNPPTITTPTSTTLAGHTNHTIYENRRREGKNIPANFPHKH